MEEAACEPLLGSESHREETYASEQEASLSTHRLRRGLPLQKTFNVIAVLSMALSLALLWSSTRNRSTPIYSPVNSIVTYERQPLHEEHEALEHKGFVGHPNDTELNWRRLLEPMNFRATEDELLRSNVVIDDKIVRVAGGGYVGVLSVYRELHCLEALRRSTLRAHYYSEMTAAGLDHDERILEHLTHCIEYIRRTVMCHADVSVYAATWIADSHETPNKDLISGGERECVNWDTIDAWSRSRALEKRVYKVKPGPFEKNLHHRRNESP